MVDLSSNEVACVGGPIDGYVLPDMGQAIKFREDGRETWHLYRAEGVDGDDMYIYVGVVEEAKK